jgi:hypothetical protein
VPNGRLVIKLTPGHPRIFQPSRRCFLWAVAGNLLNVGISRVAGAVPQLPPSYSFTEIPSAASGIAWVDTAGKSAEHYLPETTGAGCAFVDYDNDEWMDIYLVNSGKCDFFDPHPPLRNALYRNNRDGTFTDVTAKAGVAGADTARGWQLGTTMVTDFLTFTLPSPYCSGRYKCRHT